MKILFSLLLCLSLVFTSANADTLFECDWGAATGTSCNAITSNSTFSYGATSVAAESPSPCARYYSSPGILEVFNTGPNNTNALGIWINGDTDVSLVQETDVLNSSGTYTFFRVYFYKYSGSPGVKGDGGHYHFFEDRPSPARNWYLNANSLEPTTWTLASWSASNETAYGYNGGRKLIFDGMPYDEWVRIEMKIQKTEAADSSTQTITSFRVYNSNGTLIADNDDFKDADTSKSLTQMYTEGYRFLWDFSTVYTRGLKIGNNGPASNSATGRFIDVADVKITDGPGANDWIGGITIGESSNPAQVQRFQKADEQ